MSEKIIDLFSKYKETILYLIFGAGTTLVNIVVYYIFADILQISYLLSNALAWLFSVLFAFVTNKQFVFQTETIKEDSKCSSYKKTRFTYPFANKTFIQLKNFFLARVATGILDMFLMWLFIKIVVMQEIIAKVIVNIVVIVLNYFVSKFWVFGSKVTKL